MLSNFIICVISLQILGIHGIFALDEDCNYNSNCTNNAICKDKKCVCDEISYLNTDGSCLPYVVEYQSYCKKTKQCEWLGDNVVCINNVCVCDNKFRWYKGKCHKYVEKGESCEKDIDCYDRNDPLALQCSSGKCTCSKNYYDRIYDCRRKTRSNTCAMDMDCNDDKHVCHIGKCIKKNDTLLFDQILQFEHNFEEVPNDHEDIKSDYIYGSNINCTYDNDCINMKNSFCDEKEKICKCTSAYQFLNKEGNCLPGFGTCNKSADCTESNTMCFHNLCVCKQGYFFFGDKCIPELGMADSSLTDASKCVIKPSSWQDNTCYCLDYWFGDESNRNCIKTTLEDTHSCLNNDWCNAMGQHAYCNSRNQCQCDKYSKLNNTYFYCEATKKNTGNCLRDSDCPFNERCQYEKCVCNEHFSTDEELICQPDLEGSCLIQSCSKTENSNCIQGVCKCIENYLNYEKQCLKIAVNWNDTCEVSEQCQNFKFAECDKRKRKCTCVDGYMDVEGVCWESKRHGDPCMNEEECTKVLNEFYQCRNSKCLCPIGETLENDYCVTSSSTYINSPFVLFYLLLLVLCNNM